MKELLTTNWTFLRALRFLLGIAFMISAYMQMEVIPAFIGGLFIYQSIMNVGCAGGACSIASTQSSPNKTIEDVEYEEIK